MRDIPYDEKVMCENCGREGAFDFYGDELCGDCYQIMENGKLHCFYEEPHTFWELVSTFVAGTWVSLVDLFKRK